MDGTFCLFCVPFVCKLDNIDFLINWFLFFLNNSWFQIRKQKSVLSEVGSMTGRSLFFVKNALYIKYGEFCSAGLSYIGLWILKRIKKISELKMYCSQLVLNVVLLGFNMYIFLEHSFLSSVTSKRDEVSIMRINVRLIAMTMGQNLLGFTTFVEVWLTTLRYCSENLFGHYQLNNVT